MPWPRRLVRPRFHERSIMRHFVSRGCRRPPAVPVYVTISAAAIFVVCVSGADTKTATSAKPPDAGRRRPDRRSKSGESEAIGPARGCSGHSGHGGRLCEGVQCRRPSSRQSLDVRWNGRQRRGKSDKGAQSDRRRVCRSFKQHPTARMQVAIKSIEFPTPTTAIEDGVAQVLTKDNAPPSASRYTAVHVLENGHWLMASVRDSSIPVASNFAYCRDWAGSWAIGS